MAIAETGARPVPASGRSTTMAGIAAGAGPGQLTTRFGPIPLDPAWQIRFRGGLPGFPRAELFQFAAIPGITADLMTLQAVEEPDIGFIAMPLPLDLAVLRDSDVRQAAELPGIAETALALFAIVSLIETPQGIDKVVNLRAPLFVDTRRRLGAQIVLAEPRYPWRHRLAPAA